MDAQNDNSFSLLKSQCSVAADGESDRFVGVRFIDGDPRVSFPIGYSFPDNYQKLQSDIRCLLASLADAAGKGIIETGLGSDPIRIRRKSPPVREFLFLISDYLASGRLYHAPHHDYSLHATGLVSWHRTISQSRPVISPSGSLVYLDFVSRRNLSSEDTQIALLHEYCIYESFRRLGWLFTSFMPGPPRLLGVLPSHIHLIRQHLDRTYNDRNRLLLEAMLHILSDSLDGAGDRSFVFGTHSYDVVWEHMVDRAFGSVGDKRDFFPRAEWVFDYDSPMQRAALRPDTVMVTSGNTFILDAKYYRYGAENRASLLPGSSDIAKQVIYGQAAHRYIEAGRVAAPPSVYNAFLLPGRLASLGASPIRVFGHAVPDWIEDPRTYEIVVGVVIDTKFLLRHYATMGRSFQEDLAREISTFCSRKVFTPV